MADYFISEEQLAKLSERFKERIEGFKDFTEPGEDFSRGEEEYKRKALQRFQNEVGADRLHKLIEHGKGQEALSLLSKTIQLNLVQFNSWRQSFGTTDEQAGAILEAFLKVSEIPYKGPETLSPIFLAIEQQSLKPAWDTLSTTLWALNPQEYFPIKISYYRKLAEELGTPLPGGRPTPEAFDELMKFGRAFWQALEAYHPRDWIDVQSFIWVVCPDSYKPKPKPDNLELVLAWTRNLRTYISPDGKMPYKPLLLLAVLDLIEANPNRENSFEYDEVYSALGGLISKSGYSVSEIQFCQPYARMTYDSDPLQVWVPEVSGEYALDDNKCNQPSYVRELMPRARIENSLWQIFTSASGRKAIKDQIVVKWPGLKWAVTGNDSPADLAEKIRRIKAVHAPKERLEVRVKAEEEARDLLQHKSGKLDSDDLVKFFEVINQDFWKGKLTHNRFGLAYVGHNVKVLLSQLSEVNEWISKLWKTSEDELAALLDKFYEEKPLKNAGSAFPSLILYLRNAASFNLHFKRMEEGLSILTGFEKKGYSAESYFMYNSTVNELREKYGILPQEVDIILTVFEEKVPPPIFSLEDCANETGISADVLGRWIRAIERKGQAVLYGPPGTGKTYVAERLARHLTNGTDGFVDIVQFHPAYAYEDFVQGIRPKARADGGLEYPVVPGRFLEFCKNAESRQGKCVLIIDEINRANLARVFGELMYLLEYRDKAVPLAGGGVLRIPQNVRIIGTMNTADRSIALVDHALRRRFAFLALYPNYEILRNHHKETGFNVKPLINVLNRLNTQIGDRHYEVGISFFLRADLKDQIEDIWRMEIEPYLEEYFFDQPDKTEAYRWEKVSKEILP
jgi:hypothetical protein